MKLHLERLGDPFRGKPGDQGDGGSAHDLGALYSGRADYQSKFASATDTLVTQGYLTALDGTNVYKAGAANISSALIPAP